MGPSFEVVFAEKSICESREQCTGPTIFQQNAGMHRKCAFQKHPCVWIPLILLKIENWKHYSKIIFKCVNSVVRPILMKVLLKKEVCGSCEQCMRPTEQCPEPEKRASKKKKTQTLIS